VEERMKQFIETIECIPTKQEYAKVITIAGHLYSVATDLGIYQVKRAVSCLVEPQIDDLVLVSTGPSETGYILAVLERELSDKATLLFNGDVDIKTEQGRIGIIAKDGLDLASEKGISLISHEFDLTAAESTVSIGKLSFWGTVIEAQLDRIKTIVDHVESFVKRFFQKSGQSYRFVDQVDHVKSGRITYEAEKTLQLRGTFAQMTAKEDIHIDGERINIG
jgi:hypothetical protein